MHTETFFQKMSDGVELSVSRRIPDSDIKGIVLFCHGMMEYAARYGKVGTILANAGYVFCIYDQRGHGKTAEHAAENKTGMFGYLADRNGFATVVHDLYEVEEQLRVSFPGKKVILMGHSFGSFVAQSFIETYGTHIDSCILCGTAGPRRLLSAAGLFLVSLFILFFGKTARSVFVERIVFGAYNRRIDTPVYEHDWLSRNPRIVRQYEDDQWCGITPTLGFFSDMLCGLWNIHRRAAMERIPAGLPVLILCGDADPVGEYGRSVLNLYHRYRKNGMNTVGLKMYPGARHELLNEINREEVVFDVLGWFQQVLSDRFSI